MHELGITQGIAEAVLDAVADARVTCVHLEIGRLSGVVADSVRFCFDLVAEGTALEGARLEIAEPAGWGACRDCGNEFDVTGPIALCRCGGGDVAVLAGRELRIRSVEVE
ncbi:hydrogenase-3 nickel incorporation protein HypA [Saccharopolyspora erythraea NRRL 2338]|uniref:Hydrogenase maturation factor HypA n=2 Tax=Saccharopolyspora erythraea TaxID=1836 RepID=A4FE78_SACEN|nr:hydrogenase maturation nickel metallochaperone HypA [Saccharopolyspora erythraea]EQD85176.1 hydrogenase nickel incorporation protein HypA [Saccharopolyspora erythraea D]PFG96080.1 hydrogenase-3 nickel incorporation protein HypA [Saccharopolyspora erythraea NRRL 2338]QRK92623.1 hydrogenase maturation nickel metallochaperone HypA [Saccharopolyspora erythraea]CAM02353.1 hydrogenase nickel incorporation protein HypA [Saccharopolyspora erythraea NRRL 2338]